ncbi:MAG: DUF1192 domain-containing protein [Pseudomonadota bacterium]
MEPDEPKKTPKHTLGDDLTRHSIAELEALRDACQAEILRIEADMAAKGSSRAAAEGLFKR